MVVLNKIYTKSGDSGETALGNGSRVAKHSLRVNAYGTVDETNATVGMARLHSTDVIDSQLAMIQNDLFDLGADLCRPDMEMDAKSEYPPLRSFVLPGGSALAAHLHLCRTVSRRAERLSVELATVESVNPAAVKYLNRLSDWFFQASRIANDDGKNDVLWIPGANR